MYSFIAYSDDISSGLYGPKILIRERTEVPFRINAGVGFNEERSKGALYRLCQYYITSS